LKVKKQVMDKVKKQVMDHHAGLASIDIKMVKSIARLLSVWQERFIFNSKVQADMNKIGDAKQIDSKAAAAAELAPAIPEKTSTFAPVNIESLSAKARKEKGLYHYLCEVDTIVYKKNNLLFQNQVLSNPREKIASLLPQNTASAVAATAEEETSATTTLPPTGAPMTYSS
jgi:hypothetical protein